jgi:glycosyltransferase involved in cell wall biosynthesis
VRILLVSQMYPGPDDPDLGIFVQSLEQELAGRGHVIERAVIDRRRGGRRRHLRLAWDVRARAKRFEPDVVYAHFLAPAGLIAALETRAPLVVTAHGQDVANISRHGSIRQATRHVVQRAHTIVAVSGWLQERLEHEIDEARGKVEVIDCGVDLERFAPVDRDEARRAVGWHPAGPGYVCVGSLSERKNVLRLAHAFERIGHGSLAFVGDGPLRPALEGRPGIELVGRVPHDRVATWLAAADVVCQPSLCEPFGQVTLEGMAAGRPVVATLVGGPPEFVPPDAGILVDPVDVAALTSALERAAAMPLPSAAGREAAALHDVRLQAERVEAILLRAAGSTGG